MELLMNDPSTCLTSVAFEQYDVQACTGTASIECATILSIVLLRLKAEPPDGCNC